MRKGILIACRMKSDRLHKKALLPIVGKPLIDHLIERMKNVEGIDEIILCTSTHPDDAILEQAANRNGIKFFRGSEEDVMGRFIAVAEKYKLDIIVRVTGDNPLTDPRYIEKLIKSHINTSSDFSKVENLPLGTNCEVVSLSTLKKAHDMAIDPNLSEYMTSYLKQPKYFKVNIFEVEPYLNHPEIRLTVDVKEDLQLMEEIYKRLYTENGKIFPLRDIIKLLVEDEPNLLDINKKVPERSLPRILMKGDPIVDKPKIIIIGARMDGHAGVVLDTIEQSCLYNVIGFLDDSPSLQNTCLRGIPVLGPSNNFSCIPKDLEGFIVAIGNNKTRLGLSNKLKEFGLKPINVIHPNAVISKSVKILGGVFIGPGVVINKGCVVGDCVIINTSASIDHDSIIEDGAHIAPGVATGGRVKIKKCAFIGVGTSIIEDITIGEYTLVGAGASVVKDLPPNTKCVGVPAKPIGNSKESKSKWIY